MHLGFDNTLKESVDLNIISFYNSNVICDKARNISYAYLAHSGKVSVAYVARLVTNHV